MPHAALDLDGLIWQWPVSSPWNDDLVFENLAALWPNYRAHGAAHLVLARVLEDRADLPRYCDAVPGAQVTVCRLVAPAPITIARIHARMRPGPAQNWDLHRTVELSRALELAATEDFTVD